MRRAISAQRFAPKAVVQDTGGSFPHLVRDSLHQLEELVDGRLARGIVLSAGPLWPVLARLIKVRDLAVQFAFGVGAAIKTAFMPFDLLLKVIQAGADEQAGVTVEPAAVRP
jgi:hypothetical protein